MTFAYNCGIPALPTSFVLDTEGRVVQKHVGLWNPAVYETEIRALLGMPIMAKVETFEDKVKFFSHTPTAPPNFPELTSPNLHLSKKRPRFTVLTPTPCTCGCKFTLAQCRIWDSACAVSKAATEKIIAEVPADRRSPVSPAAPNTPATPLAPAEKPRLAQPPAPVEPHRLQRLRNLRNKNDLDSGIPY